MNFRVFIQFFLGVIGAFSSVVSCCLPSEATELPRPAFLDSHEILNACTYHLRAPLLRDGDLNSYESFHKGGALISLLKLMPPLVEQAAIWAYID